MAHCESCGRELVGGECAPCDQARKEGEDFAREHGMPFETAAALDRRDEREEREYEAMRRWYRPEPCRCPGDMPGSCPGPAFCPMCQDDSEAGAS
jgi:hypothetical protein